MMSVEITQSDREMFLEMLGCLMSCVSERCFCASWMDGCEDAIPSLCIRAIDTGKPQRYGMGNISVENAYKMKRIAELAGSWADYNMGDGPEYVPYTPEFWNVPGEK